MKIIHLFIVALIIFLVLFTYNPRSLEGFAELVKETCRGNYGEYTMGGREYLYGGGSGNYTSFTVGYPCKKNCALGSNKSWGCPITKSGIDDCEFDSDCYGCATLLGKV